MEAAAAAAAVAIVLPTLRSSFPTTALVSPQRSRDVSVRSSSPSSSSLSTKAVSPFSSGCGSAIGESYALFPAPILSSRSKRSFVATVIPHRSGSVFQQPPPDLASYLFKYRIVYLGMCLFPAVTTLLLQEFLYLARQDDTKPIYFYINSTGTNKDQEKPSYETEAFSIHDIMMLSKPPIFTLCVGNAWGEAALLLAAGSKGNRSALPSTSIMIKESVGRYKGLATSVKSARQQMKTVKETMVKLLAAHTKHTPEQIEADYKQPKYFSPSEAVEYGIIDKVLYSEIQTKDRENSI